MNILLSIDRVYVCDARACVCVCELELELMLLYYIRICINLFTFHFSNTFSSALPSDTTITTTDSHTLHTHNSLTVVDDVDNDVNYLCALYSDRATHSRIDNRIEKMDLMKFSHAH